MWNKVIAGVATASILTLSSGAVMAQQGAELLTEPVDLVIGHDHRMLLLEWNHLGLSTTYAFVPDFDGTVHLDPQNPENSHVSATINMSSFNSNFEGRDTILMGTRFLNVEQFPEITFESTEVVPTGDYTATMTGDMTFMGNTYPVSFDVNFNGAGENMGVFVVGFDATTTLDRGDLGLSDIYPRVAPEITVKISVELERAEEEAAPSEAEAAAAATAPEADAAAPEATPAAPAAN